MRIDLKIIKLVLTHVFLSVACYMIVLNTNSATVTKGTEFNTGDTVTATKLNNLVDNADVSEIVQADMADNNGVVVTASSAPSDTDALWKDTGNSNMVKYYTGSAWSRIGDSIPVGTIFAFSGETVPDGWLECDGSAVSRTTYSDLYAVTGDAWGEGDGSTTFNIPTCSGYFLRGWDHSAGNDPNAATRTAVQTGGETGDKVGTFQDYEVQSHYHSIDLQTYSFTYTQPTTIVGSRPGGSSNTNAEGGDETRPANVYVMYIVKY